VTTPDGYVEFAALPDGRHRLTLRPNSQALYIPRPSCETSFPVDLVRFIADRIPFAWICESIARHEDPAYVAQVLSHQVFSYFSPSAFAGKRVLDFGCGSGASTFHLAGMLPEAEIIGVELNAISVEIAGKIAGYRARPNVRFLRSPSGESLPPDLGQFDFIMFSAVYEHLLPAERKIVMPLLWRTLVPGGVLFINQTPHRYFPYEHHSTKLWLINYMPDSLAHRLARRYARHNPELNRSGSWNDLLRGGIRGGTEGEIIRNLLADDRGGKAVILQPTQNGLRDRADYWLSCTSAGRMRSLKKMLAALFRITDRLWGTVPSINIDVVIRKMTPGKMSVTAR
jgi:SAM-dependent methyltransferase